MKKGARPLVVGNWKMNPQTASMAVRLAGEVKKGVVRVDGVDVVLAPPFLFLSEVKKALNTSKRLFLGAQDAHWEKLGAHTGEVSLPMLAGVGVSYVILGHSERRAAGEKDDEVNKKVHAVLKAGLTAIVCVGEKKRDQSAHYLGFVEEEVRKACAGVTRAKLGNLVIAYEPIWAIGTGHNATPEDAHEMKLFIHKVLSDMYGRNMATKVRILYGGSVNAKNATDLLTLGTVDGFLVGGASLHASEFASIVKTAKNVQL